MEDDVYSIAKEDKILRRKEDEGTWFPLVIVLGAALGTAIGVAFDVVYIGLSFGTVLGLLLGLAFDHEMVSAIAKHSDPGKPNSGMENYVE